MIEQYENIGERKRYFHLSWLKEPSVIAVLLYMTIMFLLSSSSLPASFLPSSFKMLPLNDKIIHGIEYGILTILCIFALRRLQFKQVILLAVIFAAMYGISDELHQYFVPKRSCSFFDWIADITGSLLAAMLYWCQVKIQKVIYPYYQEH